MHKVYAMLFLHVQSHGVLVHQYEMIFRAGWWRLFSREREVFWSLVFWQVNIILFSHRPSCAPTKSLLFLKTHKTGGSTVSNILYRYADIRNLTVVLPKKQVFSFFWPLDFQLEYIDNLHGMKPDILCNHARLVQQSGYLNKTSAWCRHLTTTTTMHFAEIFVM